MYRKWLTDFDVDQSFTLPCSVSYLSIHTAVTKPSSHTSKSVRMGGGRRGEKNLSFTHVHKITNAPFCTSNIKSLKWPNPLHFSVSYFPTHTTDTKQCRMGGGRGGCFLYTAAAKTMTLYLMYKKGALVILCTWVKKDFSLPPPPPSLHSFAVWEKGFCYSCMDGKVRNRTG